MHRHDALLYFFCLFGSFWSVWRRLTFRHLTGLHGAHNVLQCPLLFTQGVLLQGELTLLGSDELLNMGARWQGCSRDTKVISKMSCDDKESEYSLSSQVRVDTYRSVVTYLSPSRPLSSWHKIHHHTQYLPWSRGNNCCYWFKGKGKNITKNLYV